MDASRFDWFTAQINEIGKWDFRMAVFMHEVAYLYEPDEILPKLVGY